MRISQSPSLGNAAGRPRALPGTSTSSSTRMPLKSAAAPHGAQHRPQLTRAAAAAAPHTAWCSTTHHQPHLQDAPSRNLAAPSAIWTRPTPNRDEDFIKPSYVPGPSTQPSIQPSRREEQPLYAPVPEFRPAELPEQSKELPSGPKMPERRPDPIPAGNPKKEKPPGEEDKREAPPSKETSPKK